ncbi:MAG: peptidoglycan-binding protein [Patescibacteria group bacterium]
MKKLSFVLIAIIGLAAVPAFAETIATPYVSTEPCISLTAGMHRGVRDASTGGQVTRLQAFLNSRGLLSVAPTGYFGPLTAQAVKAFQNENGLIADGIVGPVTRSHVFAKQCGGTPISAVPAITMLSPTQGKQGDTIVILGRGFTADTMVHFGPGGITPVISGNGTTATFTLPGYIGQYCKPNMACIMIAYGLTAGNYQLSVENANGISNAVTFTVTANPIN